MRTKIKKLTSVCLAVIMILGMLTVAPITAGAAEENAESVSAPSGDFEYEVLYDDKIIINAYFGSEANLTIPSTLDGYTVIYIGEHAFADCINLKSVTIPASVTYIGYCAFGYVYDEDSCEYVKVESFTIYGYTNSEAYAYARENGFKFVSLGEVSPFEYKVYNDVASITDYNGSEANLTIPSEIDGYTVTEIDRSAFKNCTSLTSVEIPETVTYIGEYSFADCTNLKSVTIPASVTYIGAYAFADCNNLKSVTIPASLINIGDCAFGYVYDEDSRDYVKDESFTIYGYTNSEADLYARVNDLKFVSLGEVSPFEYEVNYDFVSIIDYNGSDANLTIPSTIDGYNVTEIGGSAFKNCTSLKSVEIPETVTYIGEYAFADCTNLKSVTIPASVTYISEYAFADCTNLKSVTIPASLINIGDCAFGYVYDEDSCEYVKDESFTIYGYTNSEADLYARVNDLKFVSLGEVSPFLYKVYDDVASITDYNGSDANVTIPSEIDGYTVTEIARNAFKNCTSLKSVEIPETVTYIGEYAFEDCTSLKSVTIPASVKSIGYCAFGYVYDEDSRDYVKDESFTIYGYTNSEAYAYAREDGFKFVSLGEVSPFKYKVYDDVASITDYKGSDANVTIPSTLDGYTVIYIGEYAFADCINLKSVTIPASVKSIGYCAFGYVYDEDLCEYVKDESFTIYGYTYSEADLYARVNDLKFVSLGEVSPFLYEVYDDVASITDYRGSDANVTIPSTIDGYNVTKIGWSAFRNCTSLKSVEIPETVTYIGGYAFADCTNLKSVTIPASVKYIGAYAFADCTNLKSVTISASLINIGNCAFGYVYDEDSGEYVKVDNFTIYGYTGSDAERYAKENGFKFVSLGIDPTQKLGDVNGDGSISIDDATAVQKYLANMLDLTDRQAELADVNTDGDITIDDVTLVQKYLAGLAEI